MKELIEFLVTKLARDKESITIDETIDGDTYNYQVNVSRSDLGAVVGKGGKVANAIRTVVRSSAKKQNKRVNIKFNYLQNNSEN